MSVVLDNEWEINRTFFLSLALIIIFVAMVILAYWIQINAPPSPANNVTEEMDYHMSPIVMEIIENASLTL